MRLFRITILILSGLFLIGCAGTLHYGTYAERQAEVFKAQANTRAEMAKAWAEFAKAADPQTRGMAAMGLFALGMGNAPYRLDVPKDNLSEIVNIIAPWFGAWGIAYSTTKHMEGHGGAHTYTTNTYDATASGTQSTIGIVPGNTNTITTAPATTTTTKTTTTTTSK